MDIKSLIKKRCFYLFSSSMKDKKDEWIEEALISDKKDVCLVLPEVELFAILEKCKGYAARKLLFSWYVSVGQCFPKYND